MAANRTIRTHSLRAPPSVRTVGGSSAAAPSWKREETAWASRLRSTSRWQRLRVAVLCRRPLCALCGNLADQVHHINAKDPGLFFDPSNLAPICSACHEGVNHAYRRGIDHGLLFPKEKRMTQEELCLE